MFLGAFFFVRSQLAFSRQHDSPITQEYRSADRSIDGEQSIKDYLDQS
jgi:hypothetical protein